MGGKIRIRSRFVQIMKIQNTKKENAGFRVNKCQYLSWATHDYYKKKMTSYIQFLAYKHGIASIASVLWRWWSCMICTCVMTYLELGFRVFPVFRGFVHPFVRVPLQAPLPVRRLEFALGGAPRHAHDPVHVGPRGFADFEFGLFGETIEETNKRNA